MSHVFDKSDTTVITHHDDLESFTIDRISSRCGYDTRIVSRNSWTNSDSDLREILKNLKENVLVINLNNEIREEVLRVLGDNVKTINHRKSDSDDTQIISSLEQFSECIGYSLTDHEKLIAANASNGIEGLLKAGAGDEEIYEKIVSIREEDFEWRGLSVSDKNQAKEEYKKGKNFWYCTCVETNSSKLVPYIANLHQIRALGNKKLPEDKKIPENLIIQVNNPNDKYINEVTVYGKKEFLERSCVLMKESFRIHSKWIHYHTDYYQVKVPDAILKSALDNDCKKVEQFDEDAKQLIKRLRELTVAKFSSFILFPFTLNGNHGEIMPEDKDLEWKLIDFDPDKNWQEFVYFHSFIRDLLYGSSKDAGNTDIVFEYWGTGLNSEDKKASLTVVLIDRVYHLAVTDLSVYKFKCGSDLNSIFILNIQIEKDDEASREFSVSDVAVINEVVRQLYPVYPGQIEGLKLPKAISFDYCKFHANHVFAEKPDMKDEEPVINQVITNLIRSFLSYHKNNDMSSNPSGIKPILDNRMIINSYVAFDKPIGELSRISEHMDEFMPVFSRLMYIDPAGEGYEYHQPFISNLINNNVYLRWVHYGTLFGFTRYSFVCSGFDDPFSEDGKDIFKDTVFMHFRTMYFRMFLLVLFYRSWLLCFMREIPQFTKDLKDPDFTPKKFKQLRENFIKFSNKFWFPELTNQDQGIEMFQHMVKAFEIQSAYDEVEKEVQRTIAHLELNYKERHNHIIKIISIIALIYAIFQVAGSHSSAPELKCLWLNNAVSVLAWIFVIAGLLFLLGGFIYAFLRDKYRNLLKRIWKSINDIYITYLRR